MKRTLMFLRISWLVMTAGMYLPISAWAFQSGPFQPGELKIDCLLTNKSNVSDMPFMVRNNCLYVIQMSANETDNLANSDPEDYKRFQESVINNSLHVLDLVEKLGIRNFWSDARFIRYFGNGKEWFLDTRVCDVKGVYCILFHAEKRPLLIRMDQLSETLLEQYFN
ncbi:MAG: hypothetical protein LWW85_08125 [Marinilabiliales bacterium]|nr:hypothetical protein [Marinilabiliales bacterium]